jgi:hypothetical protein
LVLGRDLHFERQSDAETREELSKFSPASVVEAFFSFFVAGEFDDSKVLPNRARDHRPTAAHIRAMDKGAR